MSYRIGILDWLIKADTKDFDKNVNSSEKTVKTFGEKITGLTKVLTTGAMVAGIVAIGKKAFEMGEVLIDAASTAEETENKFNVVFQNVADEAEAAGDRIKDEFKLSDQSTEAFLSQVGDITTGLGATSDEALRAAEKITTLGLDIDSFANLAGGAEQAVSALTSLFTGEREAAKALGIVINDTNLKQYAEDTGKVYSELTQLEKGFLSLELAETQSTLAIGDFARSIDSYANQSRIAEAATEDFSASIGEYLIPAATDAKRAYAELLTGMADNIDQMKNYRAVTKDIKDGTLDLEATEEELLDTYTSIIQEITKLSTQLGAQDGITRAFSLRKIKSLKEELSLVEVLIDTYGISDDFNAKAEGEKQRNAAATREELAEQIKISQLSEDAILELEKRKYDALSSDEKQLEYLQEQINYWNEYKDTVPGAMDLFIDYANERNALQKEINEGKEKEADLEEKEGEWYNSKLNAYNEEIMLRDRMAAAQQRQLEETEANNQAIMDQNQLYIDLSEVGLNALLSGFEAIGTALQDGTLGWDDFGKAGLMAVSAILQALGAQLAAMASLAAVQAITGINVGASLGVVPASLGSAAAYTAAGFVSSLAGSFEQGGIIPGPPSKTDNKIALVASGEEVLTADDPRHANNMTGTTVVLNVDGRELARSSAGYYNSGVVTIDGEMAIR